MKKWSLYSKLQMAVVLLAGALAGTPVCPAAAHVSLVAQSAGPHESSYPSETMDKRLNRIIGKYRVDIGYDAAQMSRVSAAPLRSSSLENDLRPVSRVRPTLTRRRANARMQFIKKETRPRLPASSPARAAEA